MSFGGMGGAGAFYSEIEAYSRLTGAEPDPWEVEMIRALYRVHMALIEKKTGKDAGRPTTEASDGAGVAGLMRGMGAKKG